MSFPTHFKEEHAFETLTQYIHGFWLTTASFVLAELAIPDHLLEGTGKTVEEIAQLTGTQPGPLRRFLSATAGAGFLKEEDGKFSLLPIGKLLRTDQPNSLRAVARLNGGFRYKCFGSMVEALKTGKAPLYNLIDKPYYDYLLDDPREAEVFNSAMTGYSTVFHQLILDSYPITDGITVVDVAGGAGTFILDIKRRYPNVKAILADTAITQASNEKNPALNDVQKVVINFFESVPSGGNLYILKNVIHDHAEEHAGKILRNVAKALRETPDAKLIIIETIFPAQGALATTKWIDVCLFNIGMGEIRTEQVFRRLLSDCGLELHRLIPVKGMLTDNAILEVVPAKQ